MWHGLSSEELSRFGRQVILAEFGGARSQACLLRGSILVVGAGGLGSPVCLYLAAAGVGRLGVCDWDAVELNNIHRQIMHNESSIGMSKAHSAADAMKRVNSKCQIDVYDTRFDRESALKIVQQYDVIIDATDNVPTRYLLNDVCVICKKV